MPAQFEITQSIILFSPERKVLVLEQGSKWGLVGGRMELGEKPDQALRREVQEETGISSFTIQDILEIDTADDLKGLCVIVYMGTVPNDTVILSDEHINYAWVTEADLDNYTWWHPSIPQRIRKAFLNEAKQQ
jgi:nucleoside triphosphatase